jgi:hypothetical protein
MARERTHIVIACMLLFSVACSYGQSVNSQRDDCKLQISFSKSQFISAGDVQLVLSGYNEDRLYIPEPLEENYYVAHETEANEKDVENTEKKVNLIPGRKLKTYYISSGIPTLAWYKVKNKIDESRYEIPAGKYRIVINYSPKNDPNAAICTATSPTFVIDKLSSWITINEVQ